MHDTGAPALSDTSTLGSDLPYGPGRAALDLAVRCLDEAEKEQQPAAMCEALAGIARCYRALSAYAHAMDFMRQALRWSFALGGVDQRIELLCELAELAVMAGEDAKDGEDGERQARAALDLARDMAFEAARVATRAADPHWEIKVLLRASDVLEPRHELRARERLLRGAPELRQLCWTENLRRRRHPRPMRSGCLRPEDLRPTRYGLRARGRWLRRAPQLRKLQLA